MPNHRRRSWIPNRYGQPRPSARASRGFDAGKKVNGRKRHIAVDTTGLLLVVLVTSAATQDRHGARPLLWALACCFTHISMVWVDGGYSGTPVDYGTTLGLTVQIVTKLAGQIGFTVLPCRWVVDAHWHGPTGVDVPPGTTNASPSTTPPWSSGRWSSS